MNTQIDGKIYNISIQADILQATTAVKFPCLFYILWKTNDQKSLAETGKCTPHAEKVHFNQAIILKTTAIYERNKKIFLKKETQVQLNLISKSRPDQPKLVGRVTIDIATLLNQQLYTAPTLFPLQFCSVNAHLLASFKIVEKIETDLSLYELQKSFGDNVTFTSGLKGFTPTSLAQKNRDSYPFVNDSPSVKSRLQEVSNHIKQVSIASSSPYAINGVKDPLTKETKDTSTTIKDIREILQDTSKGRSKSFKSPLNLEQSESSIIRKQLAQQLKKNEESIKLKSQFDQLKLDSIRKAQQQQRSRLQLQKKGKDIQFVKIQLRQKQALLDQATAENSIIRNQSNRLREEAAKAREQAAKAREEVASVTIKLAQLKDTYTRSNLQLTAMERDLKRYESVNENLQQTSESKRQLSNQLSQLSKQLSESEHKLSRAQKEKGDLQEYIKIKESQFKKKSEDWTQQKNSQSNQKQSLLVQLSYAQEQIKNQAVIRSQLETKIAEFENEFTRLTALQHQFEEARHSWDIRQSILNEDLSRRATRLNQLEETLLTLGERVRWLEGENQLLTENCRRTREQQLKIQEQKSLLKASTQAEMQQALQNYNKLSTDYQHLQDKNAQLEGNLNSIIATYETLSADHTTLSNDHIELMSVHNQLNASWKQQKQKCLQFEELLLIGNQQRQRQSIQASNKQAEYQNKILSLQNELVICRQHLLIGQQRIAILELQIKNREDLITKLQDSLNVQIQRIQSFNSRLLRYIEKQQRMKDIIMFMEQEHRSLLQLINELQNNQNNYKLQLQAKEIQILELINQIQSKVSQRKSLQTLVGQKQKQLHSSIQNLQSNLIEQTSKAKSLQTQLYEVQQLNSNNQKQIVLNQQSFKQKLEQYEKILSESKQVASLLNCEKTQLETQFLRMQSNIASLNATLSEKENQIKLFKENQTLLNEQIFTKESQQLDTSIKIKQLQQQIHQLDVQIADLQNQILLKQQIIQEENNRYNQLDTTYQNLVNDQANFDLNRHKQELKSLKEESQKLKAQVSRLETQVSKIPSIERALKIKTIQLSSIKSKGKGQFSETNELLRLKDEQIASLLAQKQKLLLIEQQCSKFRQQIAVLQGQIQIAEQQRFNIESQSNEKALCMQQLKDENRKLLQEITIIGEKHSELQKIVAEMMSMDAGDQNSKSQTALKAQNSMLRNQVKDNEALKAKVSQLQKTRSKLMQQIEAKERQYKNVMTEESKKQSPESSRPNQSLSQKNVINSNDKNINTANISDIYKSLKNLMDERVKDKLNGKTKQMLDKIYNKDGSKNIPQQKIKTISKNFTLLKVQLMRAGEIKNQLQRTKLINQLQICEGIITALASEE